MEGGNSVPGARTDLVKDRTHGGYFYTILSGGTVSSVGTQCSTSLGGHPGQCYEKFYRILEVGVWVRV